MSALDFLNKHVSLFGKKVSVKRILLIVAIVVITVATLSFGES